MTQEEFQSKYRSFFMGILADAACMRRMESSSVGMELERQWLKLDKVLQEMWRAAQPAEAPQVKLAPPPQGQAGQQRKTGG